MIGCGAGRDLEQLAAHIPDVVGVDYQQSMIDYARRRRPGMDFRTGDMRTVRLGRTFGVAVSFGYAIANLHHNADLHAAFATFAAHTEPGGLLLLEIIDTQDLDDLPTAFVLTHPELRATATAMYAMHPAEQLLERTRRWWIENGEDRAPDTARFRLLYPADLEQAGI
jgi:trans-aconitate methyltransferase